MKPLTDNLKGILFAITGFFLFSFGDVLAKILRQMDYGAFQISFYYALIACIGLLLLSDKLGGLKKAFHTKNKKLHLLRAILQAPSQALVFYALSQMPMTNVYVIIFLAPFLTTALSIPILKEKATTMNWLLVLSGFSGVVIAMRPDIHDLNLAVFATLAVAVSASLRFLTVRLMGPQETPLSLALFPAIAILLATIGPAITAETELTTISLMMLLIGGAAFGTGLLLTYKAFRYAPAGIIAPFHYSQIMWGILAGLFIFGNPPDNWTILGCIIIVASGIALTRISNAQYKRI